VDQVLIIIGGAVIALVGTIYGVRSSSKNTDLANRIDLAKAEAIGKADTIKAKTEAETKRTDALLDTQMTFIRELQTENRAQRQEMLDKDKQQREEMLQMRQEIMEVTRLMNNCVEARQVQEKTVQAQGETIAKLTAEVLELKGKLTDLQHPA
jgi:hypothetical protein